MLTYNISMLEKSVQFLCQLNTLFALEIFRKSNLNLHQ